MFNYSFRALEGGASTEASQKMGRINCAREWGWLSFCEIMGGEGGGD